MVPTEIRQSLGYPPSRAQRPLQTRRDTSSSSTVLPRIPPPAPRSRSAGGPFNIRPISADEFQYVEFSQPPPQQPKHVKLFMTTNPPDAKWRKNIKKGSYVDLLDPNKGWYQATIKDEEPGRVHVHWTGWPSKWDEWIDRTSYRIAPHRSRLITCVGCSASIYPNPTKHACKSGRQISVVSQNSITARDLATIGTVFSEKYTASGGKLKRKASHWQQSPKTRKKVKKSTPEECPIFLGINYFDTDKDSSDESEGPETEENAQPADDWFKTIRESWKAADAEQENSTDSDESYDTAENRVNFVKSFITDTLLYLPNCKIKFDDE